MGRQPATAETIPPDDRDAAPRPPVVAARSGQVPGPASARRRVLGASLAIVAAVLVLVAFALAHLYPMLSPAVAAFVVVVVGAGLWGASRIDTDVLRDDVARLHDENLDLAARLESLSDTAWELRESEERYRSLIDAQGDLVVRRGADGMVSFVNPAYARAFNVDPAALVGRPLAVAPPISHGQADAVVARDVRLATAQGERWYSWVDIRMRDEVYSVARDVTSRKEVEQALVDARTRAEAASQAKSRVLATVSHEFRTPLNGILGLTGLLRETELTPDQETYARAVHSSGEALLALVDDMLDFSKIEAGRLDLKPEPTDIEALLQEIAELLAGRAHVKGIDIAVELDPALPAAVSVDPARLRQVLINLAGNGVKFTDEGGVTLSASRAADGAIVFTVSDSGPGIPEGEGDRLFDEFEQMDTAPSRRHGGAGLGLAISRRIVRRMGGEVTLGPRAGGGSVFSFALSLPVVTPAASPSIRELASRSFLIFAPGGAEPPALARHLVDAGAVARTVRTLNEAAALVGAASAAGEVHDAVLIDARVAPTPVEALARIREAAGSEVPAAVLIEPGRRGDVEGLRAAGFNAYLVRPIRRSSLIRVAGEIASANGVFQIDPGDARPRQPRAPRRAAASLEVLLAEDNEINALLARAVLEGLGHTVTEVHDGAAALASVKAHANGFPAILMDLHMPGLDGFAAARAIRSWEAATGVRPSAILAVTADVLAETRIAAKAAGIDAVLEKPMTPDALRRALAELTAR